MNQTTLLPKLKQTAAPTVSVVVCAYNTAPYIAETLDSLFAQGFSDFEVIVINDGSTDKTADAIQPYLSRIRYREQPNQGPAAARNAALRLARGQYIAILDSDDLWLPQYLEKMVSLLQAHPEVDLYYPNAVLFGETHFKGRLYQDIYPSSQPFTLEKFLTKECSVFGLVMFRREVLEQVGGYDEELRGVEDFDLWLRMLQHGYRFSFTPEVLVKYRRRPASLSASSTQYYQQVINTLRKFQASPLTTPHQRELAERACRKVETDKNILLVKQEILAGNYLVAARHLLEVLTERPTVKLKLALIGLMLFPKLLAQFVRSYTNSAPHPKSQRPKSAYTTG